MSNIYSGLEICSAHGIDDVLSLSIVRTGIVPIESSPGMIFWRCGHERRRMLCSFAQIHLGSVFLRLRG